MWKWEMEVCSIEDHRFTDNGFISVSKDHRVLLSGTPLQNSIMELFSLLNFLEPTQFASSDDFLKDFGVLESDEQVQKLHALLKPMMLRRLKGDVEKSIAPKEETIIEVLFLIQFDLFFFKLNRLKTISDLTNSR
jgi:SNF2 family DNA or RNA helicase